MKIHSTIFILILGFNFAALAQSDVTVSLVEDPKVRNLPNTYLQDQLQEQGKRNLLLQQQRKNSKQGQEDLKNKANLYYKKGRDLFATNDFVNAQKYYEKAISLDASVDQYYHELAITLLKNGNFRRSLAILSNLEDSNANQTEVQYYSALNLFRLKKYEYALKQFESTRDMNDEILSPLGTMYMGLTYMQLEDYAKAKEAFQGVLDTSKDSDLDTKAESYIESIERYEMFLQEAAKKWAYSLFVGTSYDSNVLNMAATNISTGTEAFRLLYGGNISYKALYRERYSLIPSLSITDIYSWNKDFESDATIQGTDPLQFDFSSPFRYNFSLFGKAASVGLSPGYSHLYMSLGQSSRELVFSSGYLRTHLSTSHMDKLYTDYKVDYSRDTSHLVPTTPADSQTASKVTVGVSNYYLLNQEGNKTLFSDILYIMNDADGDNNTYNKPLINFGHSRPLSEKWMGYAKVEYFQQDFKDAASDRSDKNISISLGGNYAWSDKNSVSLTLLYMDNSSSLTFYSYDKFSLTAIWNFNSSFF